MPRKPRIHIPGAFYHIVLRGNGGMPVFFGDQSILFFQSLIAEGVERFDHRIHAFCWMNNHVHMVIEAGPTPLSKAMQNLSFRYTRYVNQSQNRTGPLFQGRYKSILMTSVESLFELVRYIHLNPVRAKILKSPDQYRYSSHYAYLGYVRNDWLTTDYILQSFDKDLNQARRLYVSFLSEGLNEKYRKDFHVAPSLIDTTVINTRFRYKNTGVSKVITLNEISEKVCDIEGLELVQLKSDSRDRRFSQLRAMITLLYIESGGVLKESAAFYNRDISTLSRQVSNLTKSLKIEQNLRRKFRRFKKLITQA